MSVKAKFVCSYIQENTNNKVAHLYAVYSTDGENASFSKATPGGNLAITIDNETPASGFFEQGKSYYLTFDEVPAKTI